jgi:hypothetical protein
VLTGVAVCIHGLLFDHLVGRSGHRGRGRNVRCNVEPVAEGRFERRFVALRNARQATLGQPHAIPHRPDASAGKHAEQHFLE